MRKSPVLGFIRRNWPSGRKREKKIPGQITGVLTDELHGNYLRIILSPDRKTREKNLIILEKRLLEVINCRRESYWLKTVSPGEKMKVFSHIIDLPQASTAFDAHVVRVGILLCGRKNAAEVLEKKGWGDYAKKVLNFEIEPGIRSNAETRKTTSSLPDQVQLSLPAVMRAHNKAELAKQLERLESDLVNSKKYSENSAWLAKSPIDDRVKVFEQIIDKCVAKDSVGTRLARIGILLVGEKKAAELLKKRKYITLAQEIEQGELKPKF